MTTRVGATPAIVRGRKTQWYNDSWVDAARHHQGEVMRDKIDLYARRLEGLSTAELSREAENLLLRERRITAVIIAHLAEISRRKGHLELG